MPLLLITGRAAALIVGKALGREKFVKREFNALEQLAWVVGCGGTLLLGNAEIINGNEHLHIPDKLNNREKAQCNYHLVLNGGFVGNSADNVSHRLREGTATFAVASANGNKGRVKYNWVDRLNTCPRVVGRCGKAAGSAVGIVNA